MNNIIDLQKYREKKILEEKTKNSRWPNYFKSSMEAHIKTQRKNSKNIKEKKKEEVGEI